MMTLIFAALAWAYTHKDFPGYLDPGPVKKSCNQIEYFKECKDISHLRGKDYIIFRWHDEATFCSLGEDDSNKECTWVSELFHIRIRKGCLISWCKRKPALPAVGAAPGEGEDG